MRCIYVIRNNVTGKVYVGQTKNFAGRKAGHLYSANQGVERPLYVAMRIDGIENFSFEIIEECDDDRINDREKHWVAHFDSFNPEKGYNLTSGGCHGSRVAPRSAETRKKLSAAFTGRKLLESTKEKLRETSRLAMATRSKEWKDEFSKNQSKRSSGSHNPMYGRSGSKSPTSKLSELQREEISKLIRETKLSNGKIAKMFHVSRHTIMRLRHAITRKTLGCGSAATALGSDPSK